MPKKSKKFCENAMCPFHQDTGGLNVQQLQVGARVVTAKRVKLDNGKTICTYCKGLSDAVNIIKRA